MIDTSIKDQISNNIINSGLSPEMLLNQIKAKIDGYEHEGSKGGRKFAKMYSKAHKNLKTFIKEESKEVAEDIERLILYYAESPLTAKEVTLTLYSEKYKEKQIQLKHHFVLQELHNLVRSRKIFMIPSRKADPTYTKLKPLS